MKKIFIRRLLLPVMSLCVALYLVGLLAPSLWSDDSNLLIRLVLLASIVLCVLSARTLWRRLRS
ncbi:MAG: hypothetical protein J6R84_04260 [Alistipes sp.]|nr:hypothetical protein [Alistipes sp.]